MVPSTWLTLLLFLLTVSPGLLFELLGARRRVNATESAFKEISRIVFGSLGFTGIAATIVLLVAWPIKPDLVPGLIRDSDTYFAEHYAAVFALIFAEALLAHGAAFSLHKHLGRNTGETIRQISAWSQVFKNQAPLKHNVYVRVRLTDGTVFSGQVAYFTPELALEDRELVLVPPLFSKTGNNSISALPNEYEHIIIRGSQIESLAVEYRTVPSTS